MTKTTKIPPGGWTKRQQKAHRKQLVAALRSGEYRQTTGKLTNGKSFCCLGVACEISGLGGWVGRTDWFYEVDGTPSNAVNLPQPVQDWLGFTDSIGAYGDGSFIGTSLAQQNDDGKNFKTIADIIESEPEGLVIK